MKSTSHKVTFFGQSKQSLTETCSSQWNMPGYIADQLQDWVFRKNTTDVALMTNLSKLNRARLLAELVVCESELHSHQIASDGTQKLLLQWPEVGADEEQRPLLEQVHPNRRGDSSRQTECVMIPTPDRKTACISSQVGCPVGCAFCASGIGGLDGNLTTARIVEQVWQLAQLENVGRISNVVFMGMGEPLANYAAVTDAIRILNAPWGMGISARKITVSTVGLPAAIRKLVHFELPITLALSLHAPDDDLRRELIPWAAYTSIAELLDACSEYFRTTGREVTLEYILLGSVNDQLTHARELAVIAKQLRANVNLIRYNEVAGLPFKRPADTDVLAFQRTLRTAGINAHIRASRGRDIAAACGQLRHEKQDSPSRRGGRTEGRRDLRVDEAK
ncbi:MAG: 23S rRNA (adenine(2503)-C(2))-methyltransferase RlmN [Phycisphaerales bacterium]